MRLLYYTTAWISLLLGILGIFLPLLPTTPFIILASLCFSKSSPKMHNWLTSIPVFADAIIDWEKHKAIRPKIKLLAVSMMAISVGTTIVYSKISIFLKIFLGLIFIFVSAFIITRNSYPKDERE